MPFARALLPLLLATVTSSASAQTTRPTTAPSAEPLRLECIEFQWQRGDEPVRMIARDEGFCYLTKIQGKFAGGGEQVRVYVADDGYWYLGGQASQGVFASAIAIRFPSPLAVSVIRAPAGRALNELRSLAESERPDVRRAAEAELRPAEVANGARKLAQAEAWLALAEADTTPLQPKMHAHAVELLRDAAPALPAAERDAARRQAVSLAADFAGKHLNELAEWIPQSGKWDVTPDGKIRGRGDSVLAFRCPIPGNGEISFHLMVLDGVRPRIHFDGTGLHFGNEGNERVMEMHGAQKQNGVRFAYEYDQDIAVTVRFDQKNFELLVNGEPRAKGQRKSLPQLINLRLSTGDDFSRGTCLFWGFKFTPMAGGKP